MMAVLSNQLEKKGNMKRLEKLCTIFTEWCEKNKLEPVSADFMLASGNINQKQEKWLKKFITVWLKAQLLTMIK